MTASSGPGDVAMAAVIGYLRAQRGVDFSGYRPTTLGRRVQQAMAKANVSDLEGYLDHLQANPGSLDDLLDTLLINVTSFFRDEQIWQDLQTAVVPSLLERSAGRSVRVWSAGCATGEEAYSLAIVLAELVGREALRERVKIYATDVDIAALAVARAATYSGRVVADIPAPWREKYFDQTSDDTWRVQSDLRRAVVFGRNDIVQDAPISRIDLLVCRNTLMYFTADVQARILDRLHFATATGGVLMLGRAETAQGHQGLFSPLDGYRRLFRKEELAGGEPRRGLSLAGDDSAEATSELERLHRQGMREVPLAQVVISRSGRITYVNRRAVEMLPVTEKDLGRLVQDVDLSFRPVDLRSLLLRVRSELRSAAARDVAWLLPSGQEMILDVEVSPLIEPDGSLLGTSVTYRDVTAVHQLRVELDDVRERLQASFEEVQAATEELETTNEGFETTTEELQSTVEELETTNEELQSANEELETTNEELRAVNDELHARGAEEHALTAQAQDLNKILDMVMAGLSTGVIVVDSQLRIVVWTHTSEELWGLRADEVIGQSLESLDMGLDPTRLVHHARAVLATGPQNRTAAQDRPDGRRGATSGSGSPREGRGTSFREPDTSEWIEAINRRGKPIRIRLTAQPVRLNDGFARVILTVEAGGPDLRGHAAASTAGSLDAKADGHE